MDLSIYLAATEVELRHIAAKRGPLAYMACRFSPSGTGISSLPSNLPAGSMLMLTDEFPVQGHDPSRVAQELLQTASDLSCSQILLDFQRANEKQAVQVASAILKDATIPVGISQQYAAHFDCPVLVSPPPLWTPLAEYLAPWFGRDIWLEAVLEDATVTLTEEGSRYTACEIINDTPFFCDDLSISYGSYTTPTAIHFHLHRGKTELEHLLGKAHNLGVTTAIGLYQQLSK